MNLDCPSTIAKHFANLFLRDPLYVTDEQVYPNETNSNQLFRFEVCFSLSKSIENVKL